VLEPAEQIQIYQIVQEAISNVCRHSAATHVRLRLAVETNGEMVIELEDKGRGFDTNKLGKKGRGLTNIRSRASLIEANVTWNELPAAERCLPFARHPHLIASCSVKLPGCGAALTDLPRI
jgi:signal transduction histidine kinase